MTRHLLPLLATIGLTAAGCKSTQAQGPAPATAATSVRPTQFAERHMPPPTHISPEVRAALKRTMNAHGDDLTMVLWSILFLDLESAGDWAKLIADRPPLTAETDQKLRIPPAILTLGAQLHSQATKLAELAKQPERDSQAVARAFGELAETCVGCHRSYLYDKPAEPLE